MKHPCMKSIRTNKKGNNIRVCLFSAVSGRLLKVLSVNKTYQMANLYIEEAYKNESLRKRWNY